MVTEAKGFDLDINPDGTVPPFDKVADLLNAVLPYAETVGVDNPGYVRELDTVVRQFPPHSTRFFPDGLASLTEYDAKEYTKFIYDKVPTYTTILRAVIAGAMVTIPFRSIHRWESDA